MISTARMMPLVFLAAIASSVALALTARLDDFGESPIVGISLLGIFLTSMCLLAIAVVLSFRRSPLTSLSWLYFVSSLLAFIIASAFVPPK